MDTNKTIKGGNENLPEPQYFNGKEYNLYTGQRYYSRHNTRLHRVVWEHFNGEIPEGYHIHHVDGNPRNNDISNLNMVWGSLHLRHEGRKRARENPEEIKEFQRLGREAAKEWHASEEGREWHSKQSIQGWRNREHKEFNCECCGEVYESRHAGKNKYCSNKCSAKARRDSGIDNEIRKCPVCDRDFEINKYRKTATCSRKCGRKNIGKSNRKP